MGKKIRDAEVKKIPYMIIVGDQEEQTETLSVRQHGGEDLGTVNVSEFSKIIEDEIVQNPRVTPVSSWSVGISDMKKAQAPPACLGNILNQNLRGFVTL